MGTLNIRFFILLGVLILHFTSGYSQGGMYEVSTNDKISNSTLIVEGKVISKKCVWNPAHTMIFTNNEVEVYKIFKGVLIKNTINVVTIGGDLDGKLIVASHQLALEKNEVGIFYCKQTAASKLIGKDNGYDVYSSSQGFLKYDLAANTASSPFSKYEDIEKTLYSEISSKTGRRAEIKNKQFNVAAMNKSLSPTISNSTLAPVITSFSPAIVEGGAFNDVANNVLTINGSGFSNTPSGSAAVQFPHADMAAGNFYTVPFDSSLIISWTDAQIKVRVPSQAGTGIFRVRDNSGSLVTAPSSLNVLFTVLSAYVTGFGQKQFNLVNINGSGGYSLVYSTNTANSGVDLNASTAKGTFQRALNTWKETTGVNFTEAGTTTIQTVAGDGQNVVMFDNGGTGLPPMPSGVLATCYSYLAYCTPANPANQVLKSGFDIVIRNEGFSSGTVSFTFGPCSPYNSTAGNQVDLETVVLHELGHALDLSHIIDPVEPGAGVGQSNPSKLMNFSVTTNARRISLDYSSKSGAAYTVTPHGLSYGGCLPASSEMTPLATTLESKDECPASFPTTITPLFTSVHFDLVHATSNKTVDPVFTKLTTDGTGTSVTNTAYYAFKTNSAGGDLSLEVTNYNTTPASLAACALGTTAVPVTGIQMSIYKVASCPAPNAFPTPVSFLTFKANGVIPPITGLAADATYLMLLDGVEDTKATFDVVFSGSALPLKFNEFDGAIFPTFNTLSWQTDKAFEVESLNLERSSDGVNYEDIYVITNADTMANGSYNDGRFLPGANYYRLAVHNSNGSIIYSKVVLLTRTETFRVNAFPNPAVQTLNVEILSNTTGKYGIVLHNALGQVVYQKQISVVPGNQVEPINVTRFRAGVYHLTVYGEGNNKVKSSTITIQN